jgi:hypothetical protein
MHSSDWVLSYMKATRPVLEILKREGYFPDSLLPVLFECETWLLTLREERRLRMFENKVLRRIFGHRRIEVTEEARKLHNEKLNDLYSPNIIRVIKSRRIRWGGM